MPRCLVIVLLLLFGCAEQPEPAPPPEELTRVAVGHYCGMIVVDHEGPKAQIQLAHRDEVLFFTSVRDAVAFTLLPEEPDDITAFYVHDMAKAESWAHPGRAAWMPAKEAVYVIGSERRGGMGAPEAVPFSARSAAEDFVATHGGRIVSFEEIPRDYILAAGGGDMAGMEHRGGDTG